jgi:hypothetical protein
MQQRHPSPLRDPYASDHHASAHAARFSWFNEVSTAQLAARLLRAAPHTGCSFSAADHWDPGDCRGCRVCAQRGARGDPSRNPRAHEGCLSAGPFRRPSLVRLKHPPPPPLVAGRVPQGGARESRGEAPRAAGSGAAPEAGAARRTRGRAPTPRRRGGGGARGGGARDRSRLRSRLGAAAVERERQAGDAHVELARRGRRARRHRPTGAAAGGPKRRRARADSELPRLGASLGEAGREGVAQRGAGGNRVRSRRVPAGDQKARRRSRERGQVRGGAPGEGSARVGVGARAQEGGGPAGRRKGARPSARRRQAGPHPRPHLVRLSWFLRRYARSTRRRWRAGSRSQTGSPKR